jgi:cell division protein FtsW (lipid II flippase)
MFRLLTMKQEYERELNVYGGVVTIQESFSVPSKAENEAIHYAKKILWFYLGLAVILAVIITYRKKIWTRA